MKSKLPLVAFAFALAVPATYADDNGTTPPPPPPPAGEHGHEHRGGPREDRLKVLTEKLSLTADEQAKIKPIVEDERKAMRALREDETLDRQAKWPKFVEIRKTHNAQIRALLTPEQQKTFDELREERGPRPGGPGPGPGGEDHKPAS